MSLESFFKENATNKTAWSTFVGELVGFSISGEIYSRNEAEIKRLQNQYKLRSFKAGSVIVFRAA